MDDASIVNLYWDRNEKAVTESQLKYGAYCSSIARNILSDPADAEECVNDTWLGAWNTMPPKRPAILRTFLGRITRSLSFDLYRRMHRKKRGGANIDLVLDELEELVSGNETPEDLFLTKELGEEISRFLASLPEEKRAMFILRYWYADSVRDIAERFQMRENTVSVTLSRIRTRLKTHLTERGYEI